MTYAILSRGDQVSEKIKDLFMSKLNHTYDAVNPDVVIAIGGDGTILRAIHAYIDQIDHVSFLGVNSGHLGFYTNFKIDQAEEAIRILNSETFHFESFHLLEYVIKTSKDTLTGYAINEITLMNPPYVEVLDVWVDDVHFETFRGTGLCVATPSGSTAYNKALNGAVIDPSLPSLQLTEIASINSNVYRTLSSPVVVGERHSILLEKQPSKMLVTADQLHFEVEDFASVKCNVSKKHARFISNGKLSFFERVKKTFIESE